MHVMNGVPSAKTLPSSIKVRSSVCRRLNHHHRPLLAIDQTTPRLIAPLCHCPSVDMFSCSLGRAVRTVPASTIASRTPSASSITAIRPLTQSTRQRQPTHQRRYSSSKTSIPPDGSKVVAPAQRATTAGRTTRKKNKDAAAPADTQNQPFSKQFPHLPSVPSTQHLHPKGTVLKLRICLLFRLIRW
jgi:hypothetical protein